MKIYHYHPDTGNFAGIGIADQDPLDKKNYLIPAYSTTEAPPEVTDGHFIRFVDGVWQLLEIPTPVVEEPEPVSTRVTRVTMRQARLALLGAGKLPAVNAAIAAMQGAQGEAARIEWEYSQEVQRDRGLVSALSSQLGMTEEQLDALFTAAAAIP